MPCQGFRLSYAVDAERDSGMRLLRFGTSPLTCVDGTGESESYYLCRPPEQCPGAEAYTGPKTPLCCISKPFLWGQTFFVEIQFHANEAGQALRVSQTRPCGHSPIPSFHSEDMKP